MYGIIFEFFSARQLFQFDKEGNETQTDYRRMMRIVVDAGYRGYVGIEFEGTKHTKFDGIRLTKALLERVRDEITKELG